MLQYLQVSFSNLFESNFLILGSTMTAILKPPESTSTAVSDAPTETSEDQPTTTAVGGGVPLKSTVTAVSTAPKGKGWFLT
jgi:hypothetical protein